MAKKSRDGVNKTQEVKQMLADNADASPKEIVAALSAKGIEITESYASNIKSKAKTARPGRRKKKRGRPAGVRNASSGGDSVTAAHLIGAKKLIDQVGSVEAARKAINIIGQLT